MTTSARVAVVPEGSGPLRIESLTLPDPDPHQVVVKLLASGICHSQLHEIHGARTRDAVLRCDAQRLEVQPCRPLLPSFAPLCSLLV